MAQLDYTPSPEVSDSFDHCMFIGAPLQLKDAETRLVFRGGKRVMDPRVASQLLSDLTPGPFDAAMTTTYVDRGKDARALKVTLIALPTASSRHNCQSRPDAVYRALLKTGSMSFKKEKVKIVLALGKASDAFAMGCAVARAYPLFSAKASLNPNNVGNAGGKPEGGLVEVTFTHPDESGAITPQELKRIECTANGIRLAAQLVDLPTCELTTDRFIAVAREVTETIPHVSREVIRGDDLRKRGFGGIFGVGKAAEDPPALLILTYEPEKAERTVCWVGKGIVYDTGGLSLKPRDAMVGMKRDMGGAAALLGGFVATVTSGQCEDKLHALFCLADNAIGPKAARPDDIHVMYSGKSVEINNTDAEGRLVLADGVHYATKHLSPNVVLDMATLTGAQGVATGKLLAACLCNNDELEAAAVAAGKSSGDLVHPVPYAPEIYFTEFSSEVADMKNSVKDRANGQVSCAGHFIESHLHADYKGPWIHVDMAYPAFSGERGTGYGVALLVELFQRSYRPGSV